MYRELEFRRVYRVLTLYVSRLSESLLCLGKINKFTLLTPGLLSPNGSSVSHQIAVSVLLFIWEGKFQGDEYRTPNLQPQTVACLDPSSESRRGTIDPPEQVHRIGL